MKTSTKKSPLSALIGTFWPSKQLNIYFPTFRISMSRNFVSCEP